MALDGYSSLLPIRVQVFLQKRQIKYSLNSIRLLRQGNRKPREQGLGWPFPRLLWRCMGEGYGWRAKWAKEVSSRLLCQRSKRLRVKRLLRREVVMGLKALLVDDEEDILEVIRDRLEANGFTVVTAGIGLEA